MNLKEIKLKNFRCFEEQSFQLHPEFNLIVGINGSGKTALLDAISVVIATWLLGFRNRPDKKSLSTGDVRLKYVVKNDEPQFIESWPVTVKAEGTINDKDVRWERSKHSESGNTRYGNASELISLAHDLDGKLGEDVSLPLISYYGTMRLWQDPRQSKVRPDVVIKKKPSPLDGYRHCVDPRIATRELVAWFASQEWSAYQHRKEPLMLRVVRDAILSCIDKAEHLSYDPKRKELVLTRDSSDPQPFSTLSDGLRCVLAMVADIAQKMVKLNPHLGEKVLRETAGVVLVDELDLHLHPKWQKRIIEDLRTTFPRIQFICTTHSPFLIQALRSGEELLVLDGQPIAQLANKPLKEIAEGIMGVENSETSHRYQKMKESGKRYLELLDEAELSPDDKLEEFKRQLADCIAPYADNPAYQAILEMERIKKLGS
ncbi:AAA family ATPase [Marinobacter sp. ELB17]|uniref:AAA family ATPase n=1 Tax=Marinobacter sp. ELB17 TaxID=270374 RepID=UPI0000F36C00|nr:AAA family ATPase [Marinobacter sp. ELB17]EBA01740.1 ATPase [Marinobacter sp. ELB17]